MSSHVLDRYREALERHAEAEKAAIDCRVDVLVIEREIELLGQPGTFSTLNKSTAEAFIDDHRGELGPDDLEFLSVNYRGGGEVTRYSSISNSTLRRMAAAGKIEVRRTPSGHRRYCTVSVVRYLITEREESQ